MKVGIFDPYLDDIGGGEKYMMTLAECLAKDHEVNVFWDRKEDIEEMLKRFSIDLSNVRFVENIFSKKVSLIKKLLETKKYDRIIFLSDGSVPLSLAKKTIIHIQQPIHIPTLDLKTRLKILRISKFFCNSYYSKSYVDRALKVNCDVIQPPVDIKKRNVKKENIILHVGRFRVRDITISQVPIGDSKKQSIMIDVFKKMNDQGLKNWKFVLVVSVKDEDFKSFKKLEEKTKGYPIKILVNKSNEELWDIYSKAKIYWHASGFGEDLEKHPEYAEHFGISTVEAMGTGAVPVVINAGGQKEIVQNNVNGFLWNTEKEFIDKTEKLIDDPSLLEKMSLEAKKRANIFAGDRFCREIRELIS